MIQVDAPCKINYFLEITGRRPDGYHTLSILFQAVSLADRLTLAPASCLELTCSDPSLPTDERNLVFRAAAMLRDHLREKRGVRLHLTKRVPMGAGLGGGSSDAAAVLRALPRLWKRQVKPGDLRRLARRLGADVPFFLRGGLCAASGIGDRLTPLPGLPRQWMVIVFPGFGISTREAYARVRLPFPDRRPIRPMLRALRAGDASGALLFNRFEELVFPGHPQLPRLKKRLKEAGAGGTLMSGSGSAVFGLVRSAQEGRRVLQQLRPEYPQAWLVHTL